MFPLSLLKKKIFKCKEINLYYYHYWYYYYFYVFNLLCFLNCSSQMPFFWYSLKEADEYQSTAGTPHLHSLLLLLLETLLPNLFAYSPWFICKNSPQKLAVVLVICMWVDMTSTLKSLSSCNPFVSIFHMVIILKYHMKNSTKISGVHTVRVIPYCKNPVVQVNDIDWRNNRRFFCQILILLWGWWNRINIINDNYS